MTGAARYALGQIGWQRDAATGAVYIAPLPQGPVLRIDGAGVPVLTVLAEARGPLTAPQILTRLTGYLTELPDDAADHIQCFLDEMRRNGVVLRR